jgi:methionyl aminopeptidase
MVALPGLRHRKVVPQRSAGELDAMGVAGSLVAAALSAVRQAASPGVSTLALDEIAESVIRDGGGIPSFLGYHGYPATICASVNDRVVHGTRRPRRSWRPATWSRSTAARSSTAGTGMPRSRSVSAP